MNIDDIDDKIDDSDYENDDFDDNARNNVNVNMLEDEIPFSMHSDYSKYNNYNVLAFKKQKAPKRKVYVKLNLGIKGRYHNTISLLDSGADACVIRYDVLLNMFYDKKLVDSMIRKTNTTVTGFTGPSVKCLGLITLDLRFSENCEPKKTHFYVVSSENQNSSLCILGITSWEYLKLNMTWYTLNNRRVPNVYRDGPDGTMEPVEFFHMNEIEIHSLSKVINLKPKERKRVFLEVNDFLSYGNEDVFMVQSARTMDNLTITPSCSYVEVIDGKHCLQGTVFNHSNEEFSGNVDFLVENVNDSKILQISKENMPEIYQHRTLHEVVLQNDDSKESDAKFEVCENIRKIDQVNSRTFCLRVQAIESENICINTVACSPSFPLSDLTYDPTAIDNNCVPGESLSDNKLKGKVEISPEDSSKNFEGSDTINLSIRDPDPLAERDVGGFEIPKPGYEKIAPADVINLSDYPEEIQPYIKDIFLDSFPSVVSTHSLDVGNLSSLLGYYKLKLKKGAKLPRYSKLYYLSPADNRQMKDILDFLEKQDIITRSPQGGDETKLCCSAYLIARKDPQAVGRVIVDYRPLNRITDYEAPVIPTTVDILAKLKGHSYFSSVDITGAYNSIELHPDCRHLTSFLTVHGSFYSNRLHTGGVGSPTILHRFIDRILNFVPKKDKDGNIIWDEESIAQLFFDPVLNTLVFFDDIIIYTPFIESHAKSRDYHFSVVKKLIERLAIFKGKISIQKSSFFKCKIKFLGWNISHGYLTPDRKRIQKVLDYPRPQTARAWRGFIGVLNSLRLVLNFQCLKHITTLSDLTSEKGNHANPTPKQIEAFELIKKALISAPLYACLIDAESPKVLYTDASSSWTGSVASVLCQLQKAKKPQEYLPKYLYMSDPCHRLIKEFDLKCVPVRYIKHDETPKMFLKCVGPTFPPEYEYIELEDFGLGDRLKFSLTETLRTLFSLHSMSLEKEKLEAIGVACKKFLKKDILGNQILTYHFKEDKVAYDNFLTNLTKFDFEIDTDFCLFECLSYVISRPFVIVSSLSSHEKDPIFRFRDDLTRPAFYILIYQVQGQLVSRPAYMDKEMVYDQSSMRGRFEICAYYSHTLPQSLKSVHIMEAEALAIVLSLEAFEKLIGSTECLLICDSKSLYYIFHSEIQQSSDKVKRWCNKILTQFPNLQVSFCKSQQNLADLFTRVFNCKPPQLKMTGLQRLTTSVDDNLLDEVSSRNFSINEWRLWVEEHPEFLTKNLGKSQKVKDVLETSEVKVNVVKEETEPPLFVNAIKEDPSIKRSMNHFLDISQALDTVKSRFSHQIILEEQKKEFAHLFEQVLNSENFTMSSKGVIYSITNGLLFRQIEGKSKQLLLPQSLILLVVAYYHINTNHGGVDRMMLALDPYFAKGLRKAAEELNSTCLMCLLNNYNTSVQKFGTYPVANAPFLNIHMDFSIKLNKCEGFSHLLVVVDHFTLVSFAIPFKSTKSKEFLHTFLYQIYQPYRPRNVYCDNSLTFLQQDTLKTLGSFGVNMIFGTPNHPYSKGFAESYIKCYKTAVRKYVTSKDSQPWLYLPLLISQQLNSTPSPRHQVKPFELLYGASRFSESYDEFLGGKLELHPILYKKKEEVIEQRHKWQEYLDEIAEIMNKEKSDLYEHLNKNRKNKAFPEGSVVFVKRSMPDNFESVYLKSIYKVVTEKKTTCLLFRCSDGYITLAHKNNLKLYKPNDKVFKSLPSEIKALCTHLEKEQNLSKASFNKLLDYESFEVPEAILDLLGKDPEEILKKEFE